MVAPTFVYVPIAHAVHVALPAPAYLPAVHAMHVDFRAAPPPAVPASQLMHDALPASVWYLPTSHVLQPVRPVWSVYVPTAHNLQFAAAAASALKPEAAAATSQYVPVAQPRAPTHVFGALVVARVRS